MSDVDNRSVQYWVHQLWHALTNLTVPGGGALTVQGSGSITSNTRIDVTLMWDRIATHASGDAINAARTISAPANAKRLLIQALTQNVRYTLDGSAPTATRGFQMRAGDPPILIPVGASTTVRVIEEAATASLQYQWFD